MDGVRKNTTEKQEAEAEEAGQVPVSELTRKNLCFGAKGEQANTDSFQEVQ